MKVKTADLTGPALDWAVATAQGMSWWTRRTAEWDANYGYTDWVLDTDGKLKKFRFDERSRAGHWAEHEVFEPSTDWSQGGPIIEREIGNLFKHNKLDKTAPDTWCAARYEPGPIATRVLNYDGPTPLIAAMRCYVSSRLGDEVDIPKELLT